MCLLGCSASIRDNNAWYSSNKPSGWGDVRIIAGPFVDRLGRVVLSTAKTTRLAIGADGCREIVAIVATRDLAAVQG